MQLFSHQQTSAGTFTSLLSGFENKRLPQRWKDSVEGADPKEVPDPKLWKEIPLQFEHFAPKCQELLPWLFCCYSVVAKVHKRHTCTEERSHTSLQSAIKSIFPSKVTSLPIHPTTSSLNEAELIDLDLFSLTKAFPPTMSQLLDRMTFLCTQQTRTNWTIHFVSCHQPHHAENYPQRHFCSCHEIPSWSCRRYQSKSCRKFLENLCGHLFSFMHQSFTLKF